MVTFNGGTVTGSGGGIDVACNPQYSATRGVADYQLRRTLERNIRSGAIGKLGHESAAYRWGGVFVWDEGLLSAINGVTFSKTAGFPRP
jgi:hypothetical protein